MESLGTSTWLRIAIAGCSGTRLWLEAYYRFNDSVSLVEDVEDAQGNQNPQGTVVSLQVSTAKQAVILALIKAQADVELIYAGAPFES